LRCPFKITRSNVLITPVIDSPCRSTKPFMAAPLVVAVVHLIVRLEILALQVKSEPPRDRRLWLRPAGRAMELESAKCLKRRNQ
jgi:hypothetical protein